MTHSHYERIALLTTELRPGGAEVCLTRLAIGLRQAGWQPHVYSLAPLPPAGRDRLVLQLAQAGIPVRTLGLRQTWQAPWAVRTLRGLWRMDGIALAQTFLFHANLSGVLAARWLGIPCVGGLRVRQVSRFRRSILRQVAPSFRRMVCVSQDVALQAQRDLGFCPAQLTCIPNACEVAPSPSVEARSADSLPDRRYWLYAGRIDHQKGIDWLLQLTSDLFAQHPMHDLVVLGDGPLRAKLQRQHAVESRVRWLGWQPHVHVWMQFSDAVLVPSRWEGMPNVVLEAMAAARPVVVTDVEGVREILGPLAHRQLVPQLARAAFVNCARVWANDREAASHVGRLNQQRIAADFKPSRMVAAYADLYRQLLDTSLP